MKVDKRKLGKQIKMVRTSKRMTQEELAEMIDVSPTFISLVETGTKALSLSKAIELADVLKVSMDVLFQDNRLQQEESDIAEAAFLLQGCNSYEKEVMSANKPLMSSISTSNRSAMIFSATDEGD